MIYLDNSSTTSMCQGARDGIMRGIECWGNPSSLHALGMDASMELRAARKAVADALSCSESEIYFTPGGTASDNTAIFGSVRRSGKVITTALEHPAVANACERLRERGFNVVTLKTDKNGRFSFDELENELDGSEVLLSIMLVNNEIGTINDIAMVRRLMNMKKSNALLHTDAIQGFGKLKFSAKSLGADLISISSHKLHGPKGAGALYVRRGVRLAPYLVGGGQENNLVSGTEPMPAILGFAGAVRELGNVSENLARAARLREHFLAQFSEEDKIFVNSPDDALPYIINISVPGVPSQTMINALSEKEIYVSAGSACKKGHESSVLRAIGLDSDLINSAIRVSLSRFTTAEELETAAAEIKNTAKRIRKV